MKKMLFAAAAMIAAMTVNAGEVLTGAAWINAATLDNFTKTASGLDYPGGNVVATATDGVLTIKYAGQTNAATDCLKYADEYVRCNKSSGTTFEFSVAPNEAVTINLKNQKTSAQTVTITTGSGSAISIPAKTTVDGKGVAGEATAVVTADASGKIVLTQTNSSLDIISYSCSSATAANDAEADAEFAYSVKINGQKVNAKVYNEPVIEVSSNGAAKVVINKK